ncbi:hypothetical protein N2152v2_007814 [Parachlorella kessleri]
MAAVPAANGTAAAPGEQQQQQVPQHAPLPAAWQEVLTPSSPTAKARWQGASKVVRSSLRLSQRLTTLRDLLGSSAYVDWQQLEHIKPLGSGSFADVSKCSFRPLLEGGQLADAPKVVACKQIRTELLGDPQEVANFVQEVKLLRKLNHKYIVGFYGCGWSKETEEQETEGKELPHGQRLFFLQELMEGGTLQHVIMRAMACAGPMYTDTVALRWALQIAEALAYLHSRRPKVIHRDLKLENVLLTSTDLSKADAKLADFGLARLLQSSLRREVTGPSRLLRLASLASEDAVAAAAAEGLERGRSQALERKLTKWMSLPVEEKSVSAVELTPCTGSLGYMAPEVLKGEKYDEKADVFSFSIILYSLIHRNIPSMRVIMYGNEEDLELYAHSVAHGFRPPIGDQVPARVKALIERCWKGLPELRPSMGDVATELEQILQEYQGAGAGEGAPGKTCGGCCSVM